MIDPQGLLQHARKLAGAGRGLPPDADLRRGVSAAYYSVFHEITDRTARHLVGSAPVAIRNAVRRTWAHGELNALARSIVDRSRVLGRTPPVPLSRDLQAFGPLADVAATDGNLVDALRRFAELQELRHRADYDHNARIDKSTLLQACDDADHVMARLNDSSAQALEAFFTMVVVKQRDLQPRG